MYSWPDFSQFMGWAVSSYLDIADPGGLSSPWSVNNFFAASESLSSCLFLQHWRVSDWAFIAAVSSYEFAIDPGPGKKS